MRTLDLYNNTRDGYRENLSKYRDISHAKEAINTCGEYNTVTNEIKQESVYADSD
jgi:hypothetical protein